MGMGEDWIDFLKSDELAVCRHTFSMLVVTQALLDPPKTCSKCRDLVISSDRHLSLNGRPRHLDCEKTMWKQAVYEAFKRWRQAKYGTDLPPTHQDPGKGPEGPEAS